jgi:hypothetical protein
MNKLNRALVTIVIVGWLAFLLSGGLVAYVFASPSLTLLIDRSYCPPQKWQEVTQAYQELYRQHQQKQTQIEAVILFSDLNEETLKELPTPEELSNINTYGRFSLQRQSDLSKRYPKAKILNCQ